MMLCLQSVIDIVSHHRYGEGNISVDAGGSTRMHGAVYGTGAASLSDTNIRG